MNDTQSMLLFADNEAAAARSEAVDQLHNATAIYTADEVVDRLLDRMDWPRGNRRLIDSSCGAGAVLGRALTKALSLRAFTDEDLPKHIEGWELHPFACEQARSRLASILISFGRTTAVAESLARQIVHNRDFLTESPTEPTWDVHCGNPPYLRLANVPALLREEYSMHVPSYASADLMHSFLDRCNRTLLPGGKIGVIVSDRVLINPTAGRLRESLGNRLGIEHVERLDSRTAFYRPKSRRKGTPARVHPVLLVMSEEGSQALSKEPVYPGVDAKKYAGLPLLGDLAEVLLAPWLGAEGVFVVSAEEAAAKSLPADVLVPAIDCDDIQDYKLGPAQRFAIRTEPTVIPCRAVLRHLRSSLHLMSEGGRKKVIWMPPETFHNRDLSRESLLIPRITKRLNPTRLPSGILPINHEISISSDDKDLLARIERALQSDFAAEWLNDHGSRLEGGYFMLNPGLLRKMPIKLD